MKVNFNKAVSKIFDHLMFPRLYYSLKDDISSIDESLSHVIKDEYFKLYESMRLHLSPYKEAITKLYHKDIHSNYDFINILLKAYPIYAYQNVETYFEDLLNVNPKVFKQNMIKALLTIDDTDEENASGFDETNATEFINELKIDAADKWKLFMLIQNPDNQLHEFIALMNQIKPLFDSQYVLYEKIIENTGHDLATKLSVNTNEAFEKATYHTIAYDFDGNHFEGGVYVSFTMPYTLRFIDTKICQIIWGVDMAYAFKKMHEINENQLTQRVKIFKALGDRTRYETLKLIASGYHSIKDIAKELNVSSATISYHINEFLTSGILIMNRKKKQKFSYKIDYERLNDVLENFKKDLNF